LKSFFKPFFNYLFVNTTKKPIKFIGVGEGIEDLREFDTKEFVEAMFD